MPYLVLAHREPVISLVGKRLDESSRDPEFIARRRIDPLAYKNVSFGYLLDVHRLVFGWRWKIAPRVHAPTLLIKGGKDRVVSHRECVGFRQTLRFDGQDLQDLSGRPPHHALGPGNAGDSGRGRQVDSGALIAGRASMPLRVAETTSTPVKSIFCTSSSESSRSGHGTSL